MTDRLRALIAPFAVHGGRCDLARSHFGTGDWLDLSTGISPWSYPLALADAMMTRLPSPDDLTRLETLAAVSYGSAPENTIAVPGSDMALRLLGRIIPDAHPAVVWPGYSGHKTMWRQAPKLVDCTAAALLMAAEQCGVLVLARPGNPGGELLAIDVLTDIAARLQARGGWLIVDEAFADAITVDTLVAAAWPNLIVLRSFGKVHGLAGVRLGFVIAPQAVVAPLRQLLGDWPLSGPAIGAGLAAFADTQWQTRQRARLAQAGGWLDAALAQSSVAVTARTPFFQTLTVDDGWQLFDHLARAAILTRPFADHRQRLRIGLPPNPQAADRLASALLQRNSR